MSGERPWEWEAGALEALCLAVAEHRGQPHYAALLRHLRLWLDAELVDYYAKLEAMPGRCLGCAVDKERTS